MDLGGGFTSETAARRFQEVKRPLRNRFGSETVTVQIYNGYIM
jgi:hypothetical protein